MYSLNKEEGKGGRDGKKKKYPIQSIRPLTNEQALNENKRIESNFPCPLASARGLACARINGTFPT